MRGSSPRMTKERAMPSASMSARFPSVHHAGSLPPEHQIAPVAHIVNKAEPRQLGPGFVEWNVGSLEFGQQREPILHALGQLPKIPVEAGGRIAAATACATARRVGAQMPHEQMEIAPMTLVNVQLLFGVSERRECAGCYHAVLDGLDCGCQGSRMRETQSSAGPIGR